MTSRTLLLFASTLVGTLAASAEEGRWMCYPGDYGIWAGNEVQARRITFGGRQSPFWTTYGIYPSVNFTYRLDKLAEPEEITVETDGLVFLDGVGASQPVLGKYTLKTGRDYVLTFRVYNPARPPALKVSGKSVVSGKGAWTVSWDRVNLVAPEVFEGPRPPALTELPTRPQEPVRTWRDDAGRLFADFGRETYGFVKLEGVTGSGHVKIVYAESQEEAEDEILEDGSDLHALDAAEIVPVSGPGLVRMSHPYGFRYVMVKPCDGDVAVGSLSMDCQSADMPLKGAFRCNDELVNRLWEVSARTLELTRREVMVEGIKRDHWVWSGDAAQELLMNYYAYADYRCSRDTLWAVRGKDPVSMHLNAIQDYTWFWFDEVRQYYLYSGDLDFLRAMYPRMKSLLEWATARLDENGRPCDRPGDWMFIDWAPEPLHNTGGVTAFEQILLVRALEATADCARAVGEAADAQAALERAAKLRAEVKPRYWSAEKGALMHLRKNDGTLDDQFTRYPNIFGLFNGYFDEAETESVVKNAILDETVMKIQTPYMRFYELEALLAVGLHERVMQEMKDYWGGMLALGATSFWELYNPAESGREHHAMYGRNYGRSLCHAWGASPIYLLGRYYLGVRPTSPGFATFEVKPELGGLTWMEGKVPTPKGPIEVVVRDGEATVRAPAGLKGTLVWKGERRAIGE